MAQFIGQPIDRIDGPAKATGAAPYAGDTRGDRMAFGSIVTATPDGVPVRLEEDQTGPGGVPDSSA